VRYYRAPGFSITRSCSWAFDTLAELGIEVDASWFPGRHAQGGISSAVPMGPFRIRTASGCLKEFPMTLKRCMKLDIAFAGGGYFRLFPLGLITRWTREHPYTMTYFHPRDFDPGQPRMHELDLWKYFRAYVGLSGSYAKLDRLLAEFGAQSLGMAESAICWEETELLTLPEAAG
jgi:hypothetical protein